MPLTFSNRADETARYALSAADALEALTASLGEAQLDRLPESVALHDAIGAPRTASRLCDPGVLARLESRSDDLFIALIDHESAWVVGGACDRLEHAYRALAHLRDRVHRRVPA